ncbi:hypothetical protein, conserved [Leishmania tarentolae]|uniref:Myotubularin phosphatase domain-containing protein n=1 Tax=Leishmania tarentolae TaxID=5689 RepID=A0A640KAS1_LEITA|nr:hypothetical protein, conserved [Leishmania tarentolae]
MPAVSIVGIDAAWEPSCGPFMMTDAAGADTQDSTGLLAVPEIDTETGIVILDLGRHHVDPNACRGPHVRSTTSNTPDKSPIWDRNGDVWARLQAAGFPCLIALMAQPLRRVATGAPPLPSSEGVLEEENDDSAHADNAGLGADAGAGVATAPAHNLPLPCAATSLLTPMESSGVSNQTAKPLLVHVPTIVSAAPTPNDATAAADYGNATSEVGNTNSKAPVVAALPPLSHNMADKPGKLPSTELPPAAAAAAAATTTASGLSVLAPSSIPLCSSLHRRVFLPGQFSSAPVAPLHYLLVSAAVDADGHRIPSPSTAAATQDEADTKVPLGGTGVMYEAVKTAHAREVDEVQRPSSPSASTCSDASASEVSTARVVCRAVWPIPPLPTNALPVLALEVTMLHSYPIIINDGHQRVSVDKFEPSRMAETAAVEGSGMAAALSDLLVQLGEWNSSLVAGMFLSAKALAGSTPTMQSTQRPLPHQQQETAETRMREGESAAALETERDGVTVGSACPTSMPDLLVILFQYWHQQLADPPACTPLVTPPEGQEQSQEASASLNAVAGTTATALPIQESIEAVPQPPSPPTQTPTLISRSFFHDPQGHQHAVDAPRHKSVTQKRTHATPLSSPSPLPSATPHHYTSAFLVEQLLMSIEFSIAYLVSRKRDAAAAVTVAGSQTTIDDLPDDLHGDDACTPPLTPLGVQQRLQCYRLPAVSQHTSFEAVWGLYLAQRMRMFSASEILTPSTPSLERRQDVCGLSCTAIDVWKLWRRAAGTTTKPSPATLASIGEEAAVDGTPLSSPLGLCPPPQPANALTKGNSPATSTLLRPSPHHTRMFPSSRMKRRCLSSGNHLALPPVRSSTPQPLPSRVPTNVIFTVQAASNRCKISRSAPDVAAVPAAALHDKSLPLPRTVLTAQSSQIQHGREPLPMPSATSVATATAGLLQVLPSFLSSPSPTPDVPSPASLQPWTSVRGATPAQWLHKQVKASTAATAHGRDAAEPAQRKGEHDDRLQERRKTHGVNEATAAVGHAPAFQQSAPGMMQGSHIDSWKSIGGSSLDSGDGMRDNRDSCMVRATGQLSASATVSGSIRGDCTPLAAAEPRVHVQHRRSTLPATCAVEPPKNALPAALAGESGRGNMERAGGIGGDSNDGGRHLTRATGAAPRDRSKETPLPDEAHRTEARDCGEAPTTAPQTSRCRRPRGGLYSAASFVAVLSTAVEQVLSEQQDSLLQQRQRRLHGFPAAPSSFAPSGSVSLSSTAAAVAAQRLEQIHRGRLLPSLATLDSLNLLSQYVLVWCYTYDPITGGRITRGHGDDGGGSSTQVHNNSYLQRYAPSPSGAMASLRGGNGGGAGGGIHELVQAGKAVLTDTYSYFTKKARTVIGPVKSSVPNKVQDTRSINGDSTEPVSSGTSGEAGAGFPTAPWTTSAPKETSFKSSLAGSTLRTSLGAPLPVLGGAHPPACSSSSSATRDATKDPTLYYAMCGLYITEQDIIIRAIPTVEVERQRERARQKRRQQRGVVSDPTRRSSGGNNSGDEGNNESSDDEEVVELLILPRVSLVSVTPCAVDRGAGGVFAVKHARKLYDHLERGVNPVPSSSAAATSGSTSAVPASGNSGNGGGDESGGGAAGSSVLSASTEHRVPATGTTTSSTYIEAQRNLPRASPSSGQSGQTPFMAPSTVVVLKLQSLEMQTVWLEFSDERALNEVHRLLCTPLPPSTQPRGMTAWPAGTLCATPQQQRLPYYGNRFLSSARRLWCMVPLVLLATNVLPQGAATSPFMQAFLKNVTVAAVMLNAQATAPCPAAATVKSTSVLSREASTLSLPAPPPLPAASLTLADTWWLYDPAREFARQGLPEEHWSLTSANTEYSLCPTYPSTFVVPTAVARAMENGEVDGRHRMSRRVEAVAFYYAPTGGVLVRSAQPTLPALVADMPTGQVLEWILRMTGGRFGRAAPAALSASLQAPPSSLAVPLRGILPFTLNAFAASAGMTAQQICVMDLRSATAALMNVCKGGGTMELLRHPFGGVEYAGLPNIHSVQKAWLRLRASLTHDAPYQLRGDEGDCSKTQYVQHAGEPPYAAVVAAAELWATAKRPVTGLGFASLQQRLQRRSPSTPQPARGISSGADAATAIKLSADESGDSDGNDESGWPGNGAVEDDYATNATVTASAPSRPPFSLGGVSCGTMLSTMAPVGGASVTAMMPAAQHEWLAYTAMLLNTAVVAARRVCGVPTDPLYVPALQHNGPLANCFSYIVGHAFTQFRLPKAATSASATPHRRSRRCWWTSATAAGTAARTFKAPIASYEHSAHATHTRVVFLNCSDGWDRTPQISILAQLLLDPYYRTVEGLCILLEREVLCFGHPTQLRSTAVHGNVGDYWGQLRRDDRDTAGTGKRMNAQSPAEAAVQRPATEVPAVGQHQTAVTASPSRAAPTARTLAAGETGTAVECEPRSDSERDQASCKIGSLTTASAVTRDDDVDCDVDSDTFSTLLFDEVPLEAHEAAAAGGLIERAFQRLLPKHRAALSGGGSAGDVSTTEDIKQSCDASAATADVPSACTSSMSSKPPKTLLWSSSQVAPILAQLLDAIRQLVVLYPACFEYTPQFIGLLLALLHSGLISTFSVDCEQQVEAQRVAESTLSLSQWCALLFSTTAATPSAVYTTTPVTVQSAHLRSTMETRSDGGGGGGGDASSGLLLSTASNPRAPATPQSLLRQPTRPTAPALPSFHTGPPSEAGGAEASVGATMSTDASFHRLDSAFLMGDAGLEQEDSGENAVNSCPRSCGDAVARHAFAVHPRSRSSEGASGSPAAGKLSRQRAAARPSSPHTRTPALPSLGQEGKAVEEETAITGGRSYTPQLPAPSPTRPDVSLSLYYFDYTTRWGASLAPPLPRSGHALSSPFSISSSVTSMKMYSARPHDDTPLWGSAHKAQHPQQQAGHSSSGVTAADEFSRRLLPISYDALYTSGYLNPNFSLRYNRVDVGPLVDYILPSQLTLWRAAYTRHSFWGVRQAQLQQATGQYQQEQHRVRGAVSGIEHGASSTTSEVRGDMRRCGGNGGALSAGGAHIVAEAHGSDLWSATASFTGEAPSLGPIAGGGGIAAFFMDGDGESLSQGRSAHSMDATAACPATSSTPGIYRFHIDSDSEDEKMEDCHESRRQRAGIYEGH